MNDTPNAPWDHLPDDPEAFFGLEPGYDRKTLRRAYNTMLRRFKPERFPEEFQRIRAAYEQLDGELRYGRTGPGPDATNLGAPLLDVSDASGRDNSGDADETADDARRRDIVNRLAVDGIPHTLATLGDATPDDDATTIYARAVLTDLEEPGHAGFGRVLAEAISRNADCDLLPLFHTYARDERDAATIEGVLQGFGPKCQPSIYYFLSERLWIRLGHSIPFEAWRDLLALREKGRFVPDDGSRIAFTLSLLRAMIFRATPAWIDGQIEWIEQYGTRLSDSQEFELEVAIRLREYDERRRSWTPIDDHAQHLRELVHAVFVAYVEGDEAAVDRAFLAAQQEIGESHDRALRAFPVGDEVFAPVYSLYCHITGEVGWRLHDENPLDDEIDEGLTNGVVSLLNRIERLTDRSNTGRVWHLTALAYMAGLVIGYMVAFSLGYVGTKTALGKESNDWFGILTGLGAVAIFHMLIKRLVIGPIFERFSYRMARKSYEKIWRGEAAQYIRDTHTTDLQLTAAIERQDAPGLTNDEMMFQLLNEDLGIGFYSIAVRFSG